MATTEDKEIGQLTAAAKIAGAKFHGVDTDGNSRRFTVEQITGIIAGGVVINAKDPAYGAVGDDTTDDTVALQAAINAAYGAAPNGNGTNSYLNKALFIPPGRYKITAPLVIPRVRGAHIYGAGRFATQIKQATSGQSVFVTNGFEYSWVHDFYFQGPSGSTADLFDLNWDNGSGPALQSNLFQNLRWAQGGVGINIGRGGFMGSENIFLNCFGSSCSIAAIKTSNANALANSVIGGNFSSNAIAIWTLTGQVPFIANTGFQGQTDYDVRFVNSSRDGPTLIGCRTESLNFVDAFSGLGTAYPITLINCTQANASSGVFLKSGQASALLLNCESDNGQLSATDPHVTVRECRFQRASPFNFGWFNANDFCDIENTQVGSTPTWIKKRRLIMDPVLGSGNQLQIDQDIPVVKAVTADRTITAAESGFTYTDIGSGALRTHTLPAGATGLDYTFIVKTTNGIRVVCNGSQQIRYAATISTATTGYIQSTTVGDVFQLRWDGANWMVVSAVGAGIAVA